MSYFDHAQCPKCNASFDPEKIAGGPGTPMACPHCGHHLGVVSLFGVADQFSEADGPRLSLDDLSPDDGNNASWAGEGGYAPDPLAGQMPMGARRGGGRQKEEPWDRDRGQMVHVSDDDDDEPGTATSARDALKGLK